MIKIDEKIREKLVLALDVEDINEAKELVATLSPYIGTFKVGLQLFCGYGLEIVNYIKEKNSDFYILYSLVCPDLFCLDQ